MLEQPAYAAEEARRVGAVHGPVIRRQRQGRHVAERHATGLHLDGLASDRTHGEDGDLRELITALNDRTSNIPRFDTVNVEAAISSGSSFRARARAARSRDSSAMTDSAFLVCVEHSGDEERVLRRDGDTDVHATMVLDLPSTNELLNAG